MKRRDFLKNLAAGAGTAAFAAPAVLGRSNPNDVLGVACIGVGTQGHRLLQTIQNIPNTEIRVVADLYQGNLNRAQAMCKNPKVSLIGKWEEAIAHPDVDVVTIATPDFWHAPIAIAAAEAKKDMYVEKAWCTRLNDAKKIRKAVKDNQVVMQLGHHYNSLPTFHKAREIFRSGILGPTPLVRSYIDRTSENPEWRFYTDYSITQVPADAGPETIDWERFQANAEKKYPFDPLRFFNWRCYWDYGTGIAGDLLSHIWDSINMVMEMGIPESAVTQGGLYYWKDGREVPDMWHVLLDYPKKNLGITFACTFHNKHMDEVTQFLGREATMEVSPEMCRTFSGEWKDDHLLKMMQARDVAVVARKFAVEKGLKPLEPNVPPDYVMQRGELKVTSHMEDFVDCARNRKTPRCHVDRAFEEAATLIMSVEAYKQERKVRWDPVKEEIV